MQVEGSRCTGAATSSPPTASLTCCAIDCLLTDARQQCYSDLDRDSEFDCDFDLAQIKQVLTEN